MDQPTTRKNARIDVADVLRGLAVMGIIVLHSIEHFNFGSYPDTSAQSAWLNFTDKAIWDGLFFMFGGKAYAVFALLFGFSFFIQDNNQQMKGKDFRLTLLLASDSAVPVRQPECLILYGRGTGSLFFGRLHSGSDLPLIRQDRPDTGLSVADPASPPLLHLTGNFRSHLYTADDSNP